MLRWVVQTLILCFLVGVLLSVFQIDPASIFRDTWATVGEVADLALSLGRWALPYVLIGAVIVVPIMVIAGILRWTRSRPRP
ncbi:hypothetical protein [Azospirillum thermophilum]|uniref:Integrase n=1 Tax=Azospirillum thermophilum TaxID=2202148 RepID=A0A2S2CRC0_9PROT|nr:hypothetical protein [Azospirillum thermophilum]AWK87026.1 hypothetical protein DEW08_13010 [Azospirillum thermophilum]